MIISLILLFSLHLIVSIKNVYSNESGTIVQLFEWSHEDVEKECVFLSRKGFDAVQVSPPQESVQGSQWWTRYQPVSYNIVSRSGDQNAFISMVSTCNSLQVKVYVDVVMNHMVSKSSLSITPLYV